MAYYLQMGHHSSNLIGDETAGEQAGAILSPVNLNQADTKTLLAQDKCNGLEMILDPQLYFPSTDRGKLPEWAYFPSDVDTADLSSLDWWVSVSAKVIESANDIGARTLASPTYLPKFFPDEYYVSMLDVASVVQEKAGEDIAVLPTIIVQTSDLANPNRVKQISSIVTASDFDYVYLLYSNPTEPRREIRDLEDVAGVYQLISELERSGVQVLVGCCSSDVVLWKHAGASSCATGKFFNLRRFTSSRFAGPSPSGSQRPYFFEESLMAFLRGPDVKRIGEKRFSNSTNSNPNTKPILTELEKGTDQWVAHGWRQFLWWFGDVCGRIESDQSEAMQLVGHAALSWESLQKDSVYMDENPNEGGWLEAWLTLLQKHSP